MSKFTSVLRGDTTGVRHLVLENVRGRVVLLATGSAQTELRMYRDVEARAADEDATLVVRCAKRFGGSNKIEGVVSVSRGATLTMIRCELDLTASEGVWGRVEQIN